MIQVMKVIEKCTPAVEFNFQEHLLGGVSVVPSSTEQAIEIQNEPQQKPK